ncbi:hypothetical protein B0T14DRAFT_104030 [Immersiella caudata]|uniref:Uncharacterized protein n=1 Tax=Immersiella caudata TaxID=314043 RepID=A0AA40C655_9PEZI|nr:hypothetical protein B0T14DRAFT_104030 [Immersiella caudata]
MAGRLRRRHRRNHAPRSQHNAIRSDAGRSNLPPPGDMAGPPFATSSPVIAANQGDSLVDSIPHLSSGTANTAASQPPSPEEIYRAPTPKFTAGLWSDHSTDVRR